MPVTAVINFFKGFASKPTPRYDPTVATMRGWIKKTNDMLKTRSVGYVYNKLRQENMFRVGRLVGTDANGNQYFQNNDAPYGRTRWVEYPVVPGVWAIEDKFDASQVTPDWHGWLHCMHDRPGHVVAAEFDQPFKMQHRINPTMERSYYTDKPKSEDAYHKPPGAWNQDKPRGRIGPKYQAFDPSGSSSAALRNYADNSKRLHIA